MAADTECYVGSARLEMASNLFGRRLAGTVRRARNLLRERRTARPAAGSCTRLHRNSVVVYPPPSPPRGGEGGGLFAGSSPGGVIPRRRRRRLKQL